jgi:hypothetical protein
VRFLMKLLCFTAIAAAPLVAKADELDAFTLNIDGQSVSWTLPPNPMSPTTSPHFAVFYDVPVIDDGVAELADYIEFPTTTIGGGIAVSIGSDYLEAQGPQLFSGPSTSPVFLVQDAPYDLTSYGTPATIAITPEPSTFLLLGSGLLAMVWLGRRRLKVHGLPSGDASGVLSFGNYKHC